MMKTRADNAIRRENRDLMSVIVAEEMSCGLLNGILGVNILQENFQLES